jgi:integrase
MIAEGGDQTLARFQQRLGLAMEWARRARPSLIPREDSTAEAPTSATVEPQNESPQQRRLLPADSPLWQSIKTTKEGTEYRLPDKLAAIARWRQIDFTESQLRIEATEFFHPKSEDSIGTVDLDPELLALLRGWRAKSATEFVIPSDRVPRHDRSRANYRCEPHFEKLYAWLRSQGIAARKPLHELRKELGAILASKEGIFAAQRVLRHAQISTTAAYYADKKQRISAGLGALLGRGLEKVVKGSFDRTIEGKPRVGKAKS